MEDKIILSLERLFFVIRTILLELARQEKLSPIQIQLLLHLGSHSSFFSRVTQLAREFGCSKATISEAIKSLIRKGLVYKEKFPYDRRNHLLLLTAKGRKIVKRLEGWSEILKENILNFPFEIKEKVLMFLLELLSSLQRAGFLSIRTCLNCNNFVIENPNSENQSYYCKLTGRRFGSVGIRVNCEAHMESLGQSFSNFWN
jgi:DNA-binding MarR family transcriptional regulator